MMKFSIFSFGYSKIVRPLNFEKRAYLLVSYSLYTAKCVDPHAQGNFVRRINVGY